MSNVLTIFRKELNSYFNSPIAYLVMAFFGLLAGYFFYVYVAIFVDRGMQSQMMGRGMPMDVNEWVIRPLLSNLSVIGLFLIPMITMRLVCGREALRHHRAACHIAHSRHRSDSRQMAGCRRALRMRTSGISALSVASLYLYGKPDLAPILTGYLGLLLQGGACSRSAHSSPPQQRTRSSPRL